MMKMSSTEGTSHTPSLAQRYSAGMVNTMPAATVSPADAMVCTRLFSSRELRRNRKRMTPMEMTAAGMDAETVMPTRSAR